MSYDKENHHSSFFGSLIHAVFALIFWYYFFKLLFLAATLVFRILVIVSKFLIAISLRFCRYLHSVMKEYVQIRKSKSAHSDSTLTKPPSLSQKKVDLNSVLINVTAFEIPKTDFDLSNNHLITEFRAKYPFVMVDVHPLQQNQFISECEWLQNKIGHFPSEADQQAILKSLGKVSE